MCASCRRRHHGSGWTCASLQQREAAGNEAHSHEWLTSGDSLFNYSSNHLLQLVALQRVGAQGASASRVQAGRHVNHEGSPPLQGDHVEALPHQVVSRNEGGQLTLAGAPDPTGEDGGEAKEEESGGCDGEHGWNRQWNVTQIKTNRTAFDRVVPGRTQASSDSTVLLFLISQKRFTSFLEFRV